MSNLANRLSRNAKESLIGAKKLSGLKDMKNIDGVFLLKSIQRQKGSFGGNMARSQSEQLGKIVSEAKIKKIGISTREVVTKAFRLASQAKNPYVGTEHFLQVINIQLKRKYPQLAEEIMPEIALPPQNNSQRPSGDFFSEMNMMIENFLSDTNKQKQKRSGLIENYATNLNQHVTKRDHILVGRKDELERISNILGRKVKNNPVLVGDPGVGKTAIVEGLALRIATGKAPYFLSNKKIMSLDLGLLIAGTTFRGEFESRLKEVISEAKKDKDIILFIDEIHNLVGAGNAIGGMDAANLLKPALSRGEIQVIGATTYDEYRKHIEKDAALDRRFQPISVREPGVEETVKILKGIKKSYEFFHNIKIPEKTLREAATLAKRFMTDRQLPDSAIDLIDETSAKVRVAKISTQLYQELGKYQSDMETIIREKEYLVISDHYEQAIKLRDKENVLAKKIAQTEEKIRKYESKNPIRLTERDIRKTVSKVAGIPAQLLHNEKSAIMSELKNKLERELIGQKSVSEKVYSTLLRQFAGVGNPSRPLGSFLFIGPTGVGKTLTAKLLAQSLMSGSSDPLIQINMSEFMERHTVSRLLGAPAGYVGYEDSGELTERIRRNPYSVVLFDEIEKADPNVLNILLQILEEGTIADSKGKLVSFRNSIIILTSNIGTYELDQISNLGFAADPKIQKKKNRIEKTILEELKDQLPIELINRLDHILIYDPLGKKEIESITKNELRQVAQRLEDKKIKVEFHSSVYKLVATKSLSDDQGARLVRKHIQHYVEPAIAENLLKNKRTKRIKLHALKNKIIAK